ncbi:MAG: phospholipase D-like domain-containing protein [Bacteroidales bacterium]|jgi:phosphatidylserine/phosphatidylglycerophosphate/cardiolipin synthase-like enzyme|nr:phospholipase D-like domain-containing protein [Bacteroidales bacterium]
MNLTDYAIKELVSYIIGENKGSELVTLFNKLGARDIYDMGLPDINKLNGQRPSKKEYVFARAKGLNGKSELRELIEIAANQNIAELDKINKILNPEKFQAINQNGRIVITGGIIDRRKPVVNEAHFQDIQNQILEQLDKARVSIKVVVAWFTNEVLFQKLLEKCKQGLDVEVAIYDDGVNRQHGVNFDLLQTKKIKRGRGGGLMHDKFCVIDNQIVITGSYNWTNNAEFRNDENITIEKDPDQATKYSEEFRELTTIKE